MKVPSMIRLVAAAICLLLIVVSVLFRGFWYPGITGSQKADILLFDNEYPSRAFIGIGLMPESTLAALAQKSGQFKILTSTGRAMVTRIAVCERSQQFAEFAEELSKSADESIKQVGRIGLVHRGLTSVAPGVHEEVLISISKLKLMGDFDQLEFASKLLAMPPTVLDSNIQSQLEELVLERRLRVELADAILLSPWIFSHDRWIRLLDEVVTSRVSPYRIAAFWAVHFEDHAKAVSLANGFLSTQPSKDPNRALLEIEIKRTKGNAVFPTAYSEYLCK